MQFYFFLIPINNIIRIHKQIQKLKLSFTNNVLNAMIIKKKDCMSEISRLLLLLLLYIIHLNSKTDGSLNKIYIGHEREHVTLRKVYASLDYLILSNNMLYLKYSESILYSQFLVYEVMPNIIKGCLLWNDNM